jgi:hypothetical protein
MSDTTVQPVPPTLQEFADHLSECTSGCDLKLDGTGPLCPEGERLERIDWEQEAIRQFATSLLDRLRTMRDGS